MSASGILIAYRGAVIDAITAEFPAIKSVKAHGGVFTEAQLKRYATKAPCARVAFIGADRLENSNTGELRGPVKYAAYVIAEDKPPLQSYDVAVNLAEDLAGFIDGNAFGYERAAPANVTEVQNLFSLDGERTGVAIAVVAWISYIRFGRNTYLEDDNDFGELPETLTTLETKGLGLDGIEFEPGSE